MSKRATLPVQGIGAFVLTLSFVLTGCASPRDRVEEGLHSFGVPDAQARCMARGLEDRLAREDMKALARFLSQAGEKENARPRAVVDAVEDLNHPEILKATAQAGIACAVLR